MARQPIRKTREIEVKEVKYETYIPPSSFEIPEQVLELFTEKGLHLRWIRISLDDKDDYKNIAKRRREGYVPVTISELPEEVRDLFETKSFSPGVSKYSDVAMVGDLALFKIPIAKAEARTRYYENVAYQNELAQRKQLGGKSKLNKLLPIYDESKTEVRIGNRQTAPQEFGKTLRSTQEDDGDDAE